MKQLPRSGIVGEHGLYHDTYSTVWQLWCACKLHTVALRMYDKRGDKYNKRDDKAWSEKPCAKEAYRVDETLEQVDDGWANCCRGVKDS